MLIPSDSLESDDENELLYGPSPSLQLVAIDSIFFTTSLMLGRFEAFFSAHFNARLTKLSRPRRRLLCDSDPSSRASTNYQILAIKILHWRLLVIQRPDSSYAVMLVASLKDHQYQFLPILHSFGC
jgi:hypothetical protein